METLVVQFTVPDRQGLDDADRVALLDAEGMSALPPNRAEQAWGGPVPSQASLIAMIQDSAVFVTKDWMVTIRGNKLIDCVAGMCAFLNVLSQQLGTPVGVELSNTHYRSLRPLYRQLDRERTIRQWRSIGIWVVTIVCGAMLGAAISWVIQGVL